MLPISLNKEIIHWTMHSKQKMRQYRFSESRLMRVLRSPNRKEIGVAPRTVAVMQIAGTKKHPSEIWLMYQKEKTGGKKIKNKKIKIISAWRYPGRSPLGQPPPIPEDVFWELKNETENSN